MSSTSHNNNRINAWPTSTTAAMTSNTTSSPVTVRHNSTGCDIISPGVDPLLKSNALTDMATTFTSLNNQSFRKNEVKDTSLRHRSAIGKPPSNSNTIASDLPAVSLTSPNVTVKSPMTSPMTSASTTAAATNGPDGQKPLETATEVKPLVTGRMPHLHKLEKKQSSGDLHSRLKTRKILGVGETDDGDVHRSKLSQILGHNDQLYIRLPYGLRAWQLLLAIFYSLVGLWALLFPSHLFHWAMGPQASDLVTFPIRLYGSALMCLSIVFWTTVRSQDRDVVRMTMMISIVYFVLQFLVNVWEVLVTFRLYPNTFTVMASAALMAATSFAFIYLLANRRWLGSPKQPTVHAKDP